MTLIKQRKASSSTNSKQESSTIIVGILEILMKLHVYTQIASNIHMEIIIIQKIEFETNKINKEKY